MLRASMPSMRMVVLLVGLLATIATLLLWPAAQLALANHGDDIPVRGTLTDGGKFRGTVDDLHASVSDAGKVVIRGVLNGTATDGQGNTAQVVDRSFRTVLDRADIAQATCDILQLRLGPLNLDLLGLNVDLNRVVLNITAEQGPGNLLGNLLCAIAGLLDGTPPFGSIGDVLANLLNAIFELISPPA